MHVQILLREVREKKKISLNKLSERSGVSSTHINDIENDLKSPSLLIMIRIAKALDVEITELYKVKW